jgi:hypothetical protein
VFPILRNRLKARKTESKNRAFLLSDEAFFDFCNRFCSSLPFSPDGSYNGAAETHRTVCRTTTLPRPPRSPWPLASMHRMHSSLPPLCPPRTQGRGGMCSQAVSCVCMRASHDPPPRRPRPLPLSPTVLRCRLRTSPAEISGGRAVRPCTCRGGASRGWRPCRPPGARGTVGVPGRPVARLGCLDTPTRYTLLRGGLRSPPPARSPASVPPPSPPAVVPFVVC